MFYKLDFSRNLISDKGIGFLGALFSKTKFLYGLDLSHNIISDEGARVILDSLDFVKTKLMILDLSYNRLSDTMVIELKSKLSNLGYGLKINHQAPEEVESTQDTESDTDLDTEGLVFASDVAKTQGNCMKFFISN